MDARTEFWAMPRRFPPDFGGYRFLGKAVNEVGKAKFGPDWTGLEGTPPRLLMPQPVLGGIPFDGLAKPHERLAIDLLLQKHRPDFGRPIPERRAFGPVVAPFTSEQWDEGIRLAMESDERSLAIRRRFAAVVNSLIECLREGRMKSALRPKRGGDYSVFLPAAMWNAENLSDRFSLCQMNPRKPFDYGIAGDDYQLIFVDIEGLEVLLSSVSPSAGPAIPAWRKIIELKKNDPTLTKPKLAEHFGKMGKREFDRHWEKAREQYPLLQKAGRPSRQSDSD
ncbi:hypothetical protein HFO33_13880 [Rhizobium leguminosarum]|uniref:hypothetical protein n=1 Tax=Rhizobium leguminosarum TaxID=384 RepID=UPI001C93A90F|nr:hypothetical protein [Rhizobium leguminosarum]MBY5717654.1 hypothetical protein [Rhizobium leguminosarum]